MSLAQSPVLPRYGMDHARYDWAPLESRTAVRWPLGKPLALWINMSPEHFPLNPRGEGFKAPGNMSMPYPDLRHYTLRDYGNRVGVFRVLQALQQSGLRASVAVNGELAERPGHRAGLRRPGPGARTNARAKRDHHRLEHQARGRRRPCPRADHQPRRHRTLGRVHRGRLDARAQRQQRRQLQRKRDQQPIGRGRCVAARAGAEVDPGAHQRPALRQPRLCTRQRHLCRHQLHPQGRHRPHRGIEGRRLGHLRL